MEREILENGKTNELKLGQEPAFPTKSKRIVVGRTEVTTANSDGSTSTYYHNEYGDLCQDGMSKRFYAACAALIGIIANNTFLGEYKHQVNAAYQYADELLKQE